LLIVRSGAWSACIGMALRKLITSLETGNRIGIAA
jgi:hypothetical protein